MVFWSSFAKKIKQSVSQVSFDALKSRVTNVETKNQQQDTQISNINSTLNTNSTNIVNLNNVKADKTALEAVDNKVDGVITGLQDGNIVNYTGTYNSATNYNIGQCVTYNDKWYVSNQNNNVGHTPTGSSDNYWELLSEPTINLNPYLTKSEASTTYLLKTMLNTLYPVGSNVMTTNGSTHALVNMFPTKFKELSDNDIAYLAIGTNSSNSNTSSFTIQQNNLPNIKYSLSWTCFTKDGSTSITADSNPNNLLTNVNRREVKKTYNYSNFHTDAAVDKASYTFQLNGNVNQSPITYTIKPKTLKIRMWEVIANLI